MRDLTFFRGRVALFAILKALGIEPGDDVATQAFTCVAVPEAIMAARARPLYIDLEPQGFSLDADDLKRKLTPTTRAIIVQHTYGIPAEMDAILQVAEEAGIPVIEDCCHTIVSTYHGRTVGTFGVASFFSFEWGKPVVIGIGGSVGVNDPELGRRIEQLYSGFSAPGLSQMVRLEVQYLAHHVLYRPSFYWPLRSLYHSLASIGAAESNYNPIRHDHVAKDFALKMSEPLKARLGRKLENLEAQTKHRRDVAAEYQTRINATAVTHPVIPDDCDPVFVRYPLLTENKSSLLREARKANVELADWFATPVHPLTPADWPAVNYHAGSCPNAEERCGLIVTLPTHPGVTKDFIDRAVRFCNENA
jgi:perosamine synthetase